VVFRKLLSSGGLCDRRICCFQDWPCSTPVLWAQVGAARVAASKGKLSPCVYRRPGGRWRRRGGGSIHCGPHRYPVGASARRGLPKVLLLPNYRDLRAAAISPRGEGGGGAGGHPRGSGGHGGAVRHRIGVRRQAVFPRGFYVPSFEIWRGISGWPTPPKGRPAGARCRRPNGDAQTCRPANIVIGKAQIAAPLL